MRKLKLQVQLSVDGFIAGPKGEMDWMIWNWDAALNDYVTQLTAPVDTIILGRKLAEGFIPAWTEMLEKSVSPNDGAKKMVETPKVVFSKTLDFCAWHNTVIAKGDLAEEVNQLKNQPGNDIIAYGGGAFVSSLIKDSLIDEYHLFINPVILGSGMTIFNNINSRQNLTLISTQSFECGIVVFQYVPKSGQ